jgi:hypothetical protein
MSLAEGMFSAVNATSRARTAFSRASNARVSARVTGGFLEELLGELPERILTGDALAQALGGELVVVHGRRR